ncbi:MAG: ArsA family ATPase [Gemmatimonadota bacterium]|nr:ArsA family ATPase [Gemmatimonadota bacterium]
MSADRLLDTLPPWILVGGKGGVGKTTCAVALAASSAARGERTLLLSTDPAGTLGDALGEPLTDVPRPVSAQPGLFAMQLDAGRARDAFLARWRDVLVTIIDRGTYLDRGEVAGLVDAALPGADETMAFLRLVALEREPGWARVVIDTAPTGHTLRLLELPRTIGAVLALLDAMQEKHRFMVRALTHRYRIDDADRFLTELTRDVSALGETLRDGSRTAMVLVTRPEPVVAAETTRYAETLTREGIRVGALVVNAATPARTDSVPVGGDVGGIAPGVPRYAVPLLPEPPMGLAAMEAWGAAMREFAATVGEPGAVAENSVPSSAGATKGFASTPPVGGDNSGPSIVPNRTVAARDESPLAALVAPALTIVAGKGGVGKTTVACALALAAAGRTPPILLVSTDPAPSVADALAQPVGDEPSEVSGARGLLARQIDATAAFGRFRESYGARVDALFDNLTGGALDAAADRRIMRDLLDLAPPGIDELYALASLGQALAEGEYRGIIVDPAPTGHFLRLLEMPDLALEWSHRILRLMLRYKEAVGLGDAAEDLLAFARRARALGEVLRDPARGGVVVVALDEPLVRVETGRLIAAVRSRGVAVVGVLWNRVTDDARLSARWPAPLSASPAVAQFVAAAAVPPPQGVAAIRHWSAAFTPADRALA